MHKDVVSHIIKKAISEKDYDTVEHIEKSSVETDKKTMLKCT